MQALLNLPLRAIHTKSSNTSCGNSHTLRRKHSLITRLIKFLRTELPTFLEATIPNLCCLGLSSPATVGQSLAYSTTEGRIQRVPLRNTPTKSRLLRNLVYLEKDRSGVSETIFSLASSPKALLLVDINT